MGVLRIQLLTRQQLSKCLMVNPGFYLQISISAFPTTADNRQCCFNKAVELPWYSSAWTQMSKRKELWRVGWTGSSISTGDCGKTSALHSAQYSHLKYSSFCCCWKNPYLVIKHLGRAWNTSLIGTPFLVFMFFLGRCQSGSELDASSPSLVTNNTSKHS